MEHALGRVQPFVERALPQEHLRADEQLLWIKRLAQVVVRSCGDAAELGVAIVRCGEDDDGDEAAYRMRLQLLAHGDSVEPRHVDVQQDEVRLLGRDRLERLDAVLGLAHPVAEIVEVAFEELAVRRDVINDEHLRPGDGRDLVRHPAAA